MRKNKQGNMIVRISIMFSSVILVLILAFVYYMIIKPEKLEINELEYSKIDKNYYDVKEDELNEGLFETLNFEVTSGQVEMHKDLKDLYSGRDNPFAEFKDNREDIQTIDELNKMVKFSSDEKDEQKGEEESID